MSARKRDQHRGPLPEPSTEESPPPPIRETQSQERGERPDMTPVAPAVVAFSSCVAVLLASGPGASGGARLHYRERRGRKAGGDRGRAPHRAGLARPRPRRASGRRYNEGPPTPGGSGRRRGRRRGPPWPGSARAERRALYRRARAATAGVAPRRRRPGGRSARGGGAMNSGPTGSLMVSARMRSMRRRVSRSRRQPSASSTGAS